MGSWRGNSQTSYSTANGPENWGSVRLEGDDDLTLDSTYVRNVGMGIEGRPNVGGSGSVMRRFSNNDETHTLNTNTDAEEIVRRRNGRIMTALAILQTFHAHISFQVSVLENMLARQDSSSSSAGSGETVVYLTPKDILAFELGPFSGFDARYIKWLADEYGVKVVVKRGWKDLLSAIFGYG
jgi:hypothetical protein